MPGRRRRSRVSGAGQGLLGMGGWDYWLDLSSSDYLLHPPRSLHAALSLPQVTRPAPPRRAGYWPARPRERHGREKHLKQTTSVHQQSRSP